MTNSFRNHRISIGIVLCICGVSIGGLIKLAAGVNYSWLSALIIIFSTILLIDIKRIRFYSRIPTTLIPIYLYSIYTIVLALVCGAPFSGSNISILYQLVYLIHIILLIGVCSEFDPDCFIRKAFWITGFSPLLALILLNIKGFGVGYGILLSRSDETNAVSRATTGFIAFYGVCASIVFKPKNKYESITKIVFVLLSLTLLIMSSRRSTIIALVLIIFLRFIRNYSSYTVDIRKILKRLLLVIMLCFVVIMVLRINPTISSAIDRAWNSLLNGFRTYIGLEGNDRSASYRREQIESIPNEYLNNSTFVQFIFGRGYNTDWLDIPYMQAFWDMGLLGGIWYFIIQGIIPIIHLFHKPKNSAIEFAQYYVVLRIVQNFSNGTPYGTFFPIVFLYALESGMALTDRKLQY